MQPHSDCDHDTTTPDEMIHLGRVTRLAALLAGMTGASFGAVAGPSSVGASESTLAGLRQLSSNRTTYVASPAVVGDLWDLDPTGQRTTSLPDQTLHEPSGLASSRLNRQVVYVHSESDVSGMVAVSTIDARVVGRFDVAIPQQWDWEDIATGPCGTGSCIYAGDIGRDNGKPNPPATFAVYRVAEPDLAAGQTGGTLTGDWLRFRYPDAPHNAEALMVHPLTGRIYVITKEPDGHSGVYAFPTALPPPSSTTVTTLELIATLDLPVWSGDPSDTRAAQWFGQVTAAAIHPRGDRFLLRTLYRVYEYRVPEGRPFESVFTTPPVTVTAPSGEEQGEAIDYAPDGSAYFTVGERAAPPYTLTRIDRASRSRSPGV